MVRATVLAVSDLSVTYGSKLILSRVNFQARRGDIIAIIGANGAGKSTLLKALFGVVPISHGHVSFDGKPVAEPEKMKKRQIAFVPQGNRVFGELTVRENLALGGIALQSPQDYQRHLGVTLGKFPALQVLLDQRAASLSGGEKQMLALATALISEPRFLLLDEPSLGLAPMATKRMMAEIAALSENDATTVIVEQKVRSVLEIATRVLVLRHGQIAFDGAAKELSNEADLRMVYF